MTNPQKAVMTAGLICLCLMMAGCGSKKTADESTGLKTAEEAASQTPDNLAEESPVGDTPMAYKTMKELMSAGKPLSCSWAKTDENGETQGRIFVSGNRFRSDIISGGKDDSGAEKLEVEMHNLSDGTMVYTWNSMPGSKAIKMDLSKLQTPAQSETGKPEGNVDFEEELDYSCASWSEDESVFNLPSDIEFTDQTQAMNGIINAAQSVQGTVADPAAAGAGAAPDACALCDMAPDGDARETCKKNAGCHE